MPRALLLGLVAMAGSPALADGASLFAGTCGACHGEAGVGIPGLAPPLHNAELWAALGERAPAYIAGVVANGLSGRLTVAGQDYVGLVMPPQAHLGAEELAEMATYVLADLNGTGQAVTPAQIEAARAERSSHADLRALREAR
ncbi:c-type cytochrome [Rubellimicrobium aerolatum]|uniref:C-type cytochrome n=1 Tax=Rubellimicrobium aerolatum TaxID=490979 RepID=A0ABW0SAC2_9RHOB|nr:cytochrome c [Rubellimicrobium aerolatum]MBP1805256.1 nitrite reductase (NO-forming) [Rubellimicrobium aerolatum]